ERSLREATDPFDLANGPLVRIRLLVLADDEHILLITLHHIVSDGWSMGVLVRELVTLYRGFAEDDSATLPSLSLQDADYAQWQRQWLDGGELERQLSELCERLRGGESLALPTDRKRPLVQTYRGARATRRLSDVVVSRLTDWCRRRGATLSMGL